MTSGDIAAALLVTLFFFLAFAQNSRRCQSLFRAQAIRGRGVAIVALVLKMELLK